LTKVDHFAKSLKETLGNESSLKFTLRIQLAFLKAKPYTKSLANLALLLKSFIVGGPLIITLLFNPVQELLHE